jgi:hypothetical protein
MKPFQFPECKAIITKEENAKRLNRLLLCRDCADKLSHVYYRSKKGAEPFYEAFCDFKSVFYIRFRQPVFIEVLVKVPHTREVAAQTPIRMFGLKLRHVVPKACMCPKLHSSLRGDSIDDFCSGAPKLFRGLRKISPANKVLGFRQVLAIQS